MPDDDDVAAMGCLRRRRLPHRGRHNFPEAPSAGCLNLWWVCHRWRFLTIDYHNIYMNQFLSLSVSRSFAIFCLGLVPSSVSTYLIHFANKTVSICLLHWATVSALHQLRAVVARDGPLIPYPILPPHPGVYNSRIIFIQHFYTINFALLSVFWITTVSCSLIFRSPHQCHYRCSLVTSASLFWLPSDSCSCGKVAWTIGYFPHLIQNFDSTTYLFINHSWTALRPSLITMYIVMSEEVTYVLILS